MFNKELIEDLLDVITRYQPLGIVLTGSYSMPYRDEKSDYDFEVVIDNDLFTKLGKEGMFCKKYDVSDAPVEYLFIGKDNFEKKKYSYKDIDHWPYQHGIIVFDRDHYMQNTVREITEIRDADTLNRVKIHYFEFLFFIKRLERIKPEKSFCNRNLVLNQAMWSLIKIFFLLEKKWPPISHWAWENLELLGEKYLIIIKMIEVLYEDKSNNGSEEIIHEIDKILGQKKYTFQYMKNELTAEVCGDLLYEERQRYSVI